MTHNAENDAPVMCDCHNPPQRLAAHDDVPDTAENDAPRPDDFDRWALALLLRKAARDHLGLSDGDYWPSDLADAQARAVIAAGYVIPPAKTEEEP